MVAPAPSPAAPGTPKVSSAPSPVVRRLPAPSAGCPSAIWSAPEAAPRTGPANLRAVEVPAGRSDFAVSGNRVEAEDRSRVAPVAAVRARLGTDPSGRRMERARSAAPPSPSSAVAAVPTGAGGFSPKAPPIPRDSPVIPPTFDTVESAGTNPSEAERDGVTAPADGTAVCDLVDGTPPATKPSRWASASGIRRRRDCPEESGARPAASGWPFIGGWARALSAPRPVRVDGVPSTPSTQMALPQATEGAPRGGDPHPEPCSPAT